MLSFNQECLQEYECFVCYHYMHPPIRQCITGHSYCNRCYERVNWCPQCRSPNRPGRNLPMEAFHRYLLFPCRYREGGCAVQLLGDDIVVHERKCSFNLKSCPLKCDWTGPATEVLAHCEEVHRQSVFSGESITIDWEDFGDVAHNVALRSVISAHGEMFACTFDVDRCGGLVRWAVLFLGELERSSRYSFEIKLMGGEHPKSLTLTSTCGVVTDDGEEVRNSDAVFTFYKLAKRYCHGSNLKCNVKILARSDGEF